MRCESTLSKGCRIAPQDGVDLFAEPPWITTFDGPVLGARCSLEETGITSESRSPVRWQLDKDRAKRLSEPTRLVEDSRSTHEALSDASGVNHSGCTSAHSGSAAGPAPVTLRSAEPGKMVERVVDLRGIEMTRRRLTNSSSGDSWGRRLPASSQSGRLRFRSEA